MPESKKLEECEDKMPPEKNDVIIVFKMLFS
jgi:hypothetical protein